MTAAERATRKQREDDATCAALLHLLQRIKAHHRGESPIR